MTQQSSEITEVERAAQEEAAGILSEILGMVVSSPTAEGAQGAEGTGGEYDGPFPHNAVVRGHAEVQAALLDLQKKGATSQEWDGGLLNALRSFGYKV